MVRSASRLGKYADRFQARLRSPSTVSGINHWAAGAVRAWKDRAHLAALVIDGHHTGIPELGDFKQTAVRADDAGLWHSLTSCPESLDELIKRMASEGIASDAPPPRSRLEPFVESLWTRMLFSCLVDADFLDTERHFSPAIKSQRVVPALDAAGALGLLRTHLAKKGGVGPVNDLRRRLLADCLGQAESAPGLFTLTAPTGSGKTLASLAFALRHIERHNATLAPDSPERLRRIIVVIPYTSIIEQTAAVFRDLFEKEFGADFVLEHHAAVAPRERAEDAGRDAENERIRRARLAAENWESPLVVTTSVRFFESLFANRPSDCRKLHNIARSVILFDEVQTLPPSRVPSLLSGVQALVQHFGCTAVFMTATQPAFTTAEHVVLRGWRPMEISSSPRAMAETMRRTRIDLPRSDERPAWSEIAQRLSASAQALCVVNTTAAAGELFRLLPAQGRFHLSSRMCANHRQGKLDAIRLALASGDTCRLVSTQLIEAGVDVDFPIAYRALGPLDSIIQTAGRCNREGRSSEPCPVVVFRPAEDKLPPGAYATATAATVNFLHRYADASERLHDPDFYAAYFAELYELLGRSKPTDDPVFDYSAKLDFPKAHNARHLIEQGTRAVLVEWGEGAALIAKLQREHHLTAEECRRAQRFSINLYAHEFERGQREGWIVQPAEKWDLFAWKSNYDPDLGACHAAGADFCP